MTEHTYFRAQEHITLLAFDAIAHCHTAQTPEKKREYYNIYQNLCEGARQLRIAYTATLQKQIQKQRG